jgi:hypothetical protein
MLRLYIEILAFKTVWSEATKWLYRFFQMAESVSEIEQHSEQNAVVAHMD